MQPIKEYVTIYLNIIIRQSYLTMFIGTGTDIFGLSFSFFQSRFRSLIRK